MAKIGYGYGSEFQLLRFMGRHRLLLEEIIKKSINVDGTIKWLDFEFKDLDNDFVGDKELAGVDFLNQLSFVTDETIKEINREIDNYEVRPMVSRQSWDALFTIDDTLYIVEAKAHYDEMLTKDYERASNEKILAFMKAMLPEINVTEEWLKDYYQLANRLAFSALLSKHGVKTKTMCLFFENGYQRKAIINNELRVLTDKDTSRQQFEDAMEKEMKTLGITHKNIYDIMTPSVFVDANPKRLKNEYNKQNIRYTDVI